MENIDVNELIESTRGLLFGDDARDMIKILECISKIVYDCGCYRNTTLNRYSENYGPVLARLESDIPENSDKMRLRIALTPEYIKRMSHDVDYLSKFFKSLTEFVDDGNEILSKLESDKKPAQSTAKKPTATIDEF